MEDSLRNIFFAYELVECLFDRVQFPWVSVKETVLYKHAIQDLKFDEVIGRAVHYCMDLCAHSLTECYVEMQKILGDSAEKFTSLALSSLPDHFPKGYTHEHFIAFCALISGVSYFLAVKGNWYYGDLASETIATTLTTFTLTREFQDKGGFDGLTKYCLEFEQRLYAKDREAQKNNEN